MDDSQHAAVANPHNSPSSGDAVESRGQQHHQQDACLKAVNPVKLKKSGSNRASGWDSVNRPAWEGGLPSNTTSGKRSAFDTVPFTPGQGAARTPSNSAGQFNFDPYWGWGYSGRESPNPLLRGASDAGEHAAGFAPHVPFPPYMMAYSMAFSTGAESSNPQYPPPSPLMGSPVGTPTAMMFPQTPFAGTHHSFSPYPTRNSSHNFSAASPTRSPSFPEPFSPMSPTGYFHPMFNNFPAFLMPPPRSSVNGASPRKAPSGNGGWAHGAGAPAGHDRSSNGAAKSQLPQQQHQQHQQHQRQGRLSEESGDGGGMFDFGAGGLGLGWGAPMPLADPTGASLWGAKFPHFPPYGFPPPGGSLPSRASSSSGVAPYGMPMHLLQPLFAMGSMGSGSFNGGAGGWPAQVPPPGAPSPPPLGPAAKGRAGVGPSVGMSRSGVPGTAPMDLPAQPPQDSETASAMGTHPTASSTSLAAPTHPLASSGSSSCTTIPSTPAHSPPNPGAGSVGSSQGPGSSSSHKGSKPRPPPLQLNVLSGSGLASNGGGGRGMAAAMGVGPVHGGHSGGGNNGGGPAGLGAPSAAAMLFPPPGQHGPALPVQLPPHHHGPWPEGAPPSAPAPSAPDTAAKEPPYAAPPPCPAPGTGAPFLAMPGPFNLGPSAFMPVPMPMPFLPHMLPGGGMPFLAQMMPPGLHSLMAPAGFPPGMPVPTPPHRSHGHFPLGGAVAHHAGAANLAGSPYTRNGPFPHGHAHHTPPNSSSKGRRPHQQHQHQHQPQQGGPASQPQPQPQLQPQPQSQLQLPLQQGGSPGAPGGASAAAKADAMPRLNARQRRTLRRAKERAIKGLMDAGHLALKQHQGEGQLQGHGRPSACKPGKEERGSEDLSGSDAEDPLRAAALGEDTATSLYVSAAMSVVAGSHGPEAAANASQAISKVAADLDDVDLTNLISHLSQRKVGGASGSSSLGGGEPYPAGDAAGAAGHLTHPTAGLQQQQQQPFMEEGLLRDLTIIQNLIGILKVQGEAGKGGGGAAAGLGDKPQGGREGTGQATPHERGQVLHGQQQQQQQQQQGRQAGRQQLQQHGQPGRQAGRQAQGQQGSHSPAGRPKGGGGPHASTMIHLKAVC